MRRYGRCAEARFLDGVCLATWSPREAEAIIARYHRPDPACPLGSLLGVIASWINLYVLTPLHVTSPKQATSLNIITYLQEYRFFKKFSPSPSPALFNL